MITSDRKFGIEIEFVSPTASSITKISNKIRVIEDGSLRPLNHAGEYVSSPMIGKKGEDEIRRVCDILNKNKASGENSKTSVHIHLDGRIAEGVMRSSNKKTESANQIAISNRLKKVLSGKDILSIVRGEMFRVSTKTEFEAYVFDDVTYLSKAKLTRRPRLNYTYYSLERPNRFNWLRNVFYFYTMFSDVMEGIVSRSRRYGNMYCVPLGSAYNLDDIAKASEMKELKKVWYKGKSPGGHYCNSRYKDVNLHSFWDRHGTVEIRSHGGTTDADKILLWLKLHQKIVDKLEDISIEELQRVRATPLGFIRFIEEPLLQDYVKRLLGFYSGINVK